jgi:leucyl-tRNA synthetase
MVHAAAPFLAAPGTTADTAGHPAAHALRALAHRTLADVSAAIERLRFNTAIAKLYAFVGELQEIADKPDALLANDPVHAAAAREAFDILVRMIAPMMPHLAEECWSALGYQGLVSVAPWPQIQPDLLEDDTITLPVQVNGRKRADVTVPRDAKNPEIEAAVLALDAVKRALEGKAPRKVIVVPKRIVNVVG